MSNRAFRWSLSPCDLLGLGATAAMKMVGEDFPFTKDSSFFYVRINHNSMLGVRCDATHESLGGKS